ncbi:alanine racemase [Microbacterium sp. CFBP9034]|uniref:alanine racemase n=1 Tax=Microbacterium sp. CFBP9034 TaxID=3096540 RepID=UPI002A6A2F41|nr:alanine racemase [Microbacterium sp. CFBP9034]MDY0909718.1 alanine racemase [Microbacterium sp. CFBP9034]
MTGVLHVDLDTIAANIARVRTVVGAAELMLVVKDDAYGHGLDAVVRRAWREGVCWIGAFDVATGRRVREVLGEDVRIFSWIAASRAEVAEAIAFDLDLGVGDADLLEDVASEARAVGARVRVHLKVDTGLHRNGVRPEDWPAFVRRAAELAAEGLVDVVGVWSHISEASDEDDDEARALFDAAVDAARGAGLAPELRHLSASAASFARPEFRYDLVRVGAFCFGIRPAGGPASDALGIQPAATLEGRVISVAAGRVTIDVGALDGVPSRLGGLVSVGTPAGSRRLLTVGAVSTVEDWPDAAPGDTVTVYGPGRHGEGSATDLAEAIETIGEEIAVRVSPLVPRVYAGE